MEEKFKVRYENMPLGMVFDQKPISEIRYQFVNLPADPPIFHLVSSAISRREILQEISRFYGLDMHVQMVGGEPSYVVVRGKGAPLPAPPPPSQPGPAPAPALQAPPAYQPGAPAQSGAAYNAAPAPSAPLGVPPGSQEL